MKSLTSLNNIQKSVLNALLEKYDNSKTFKGSNKVRQNFYIRPEDIFPDYKDDFADAARISDFENDIEYLERENLVKVKKSGSVIMRVYAVTEKIPMYHEIIGIIDKRETLNNFGIILRGFMGRNPFLDKICSEQLNRVENFKAPNIVQNPNAEKLERILKCLDFILNNKEEILERELSIKIFGDSKIFEKEMKTKVCTLLEKYCVLNFEDFHEDDKNIKNEMLLSHFQVLKNPTYFYFKGNGHVIFSDGTKVELSYRFPVALCSDSVKDITDIKISCGTIMTIENLTSFNRYCSKETFCLFLSGYNNSCKTEFLKKIFADNSQKNWLHFGDTDPCGFLILHNLRTKTGIDFQPYLMGIYELTCFERYCKPLEPNDITKAKSMVENQIYPNIARFMLDSNHKLEQEIISWKNK